MVDRTDKTHPVRNIFLLLFLSLPFLWSCEKKDAQAPPPAPKVTVAAPQRQDVTDYVELTGTTQAINTVQLRARVEGYLEQVLFKDGEFVKSGQPLFIIQQNTYRARLQQAEGNVLTQKARLEHAKNELARFSNLFSQRAAAQTEVENWRYERDSAQAALMTAEAQRDLAKLDVAYTEVSAPFNGRIDRRLRDPGNLVGSGESTVLAEISQTDPLYVYFNVSETDLARLRHSPGIDRSKPNGEKLPVWIGLAGEQGYAHEGYLDFAATSVNSTTGTLLLRGIFPNPDGAMLPGQFARLRVIVGEKKGALLLPRTAVGYDQLGSFVLVVNEKNIVERRNVREGLSREAFVVIEEGLVGNEQVIVNGIVRAAPGRQVVPEREGGGQAGAPEQPSGREVQGTANPSAEKGPGK